MEYFEERILIASYMKRLYNRGLTTSSGGNISHKISDNILLISPSQKDKSRLKPYDICVADFDGNNLTPKLKCSMELMMHIAIYKQRSDINSICHAHPTFASSYSYTDEVLNTSHSGEMRAICGEIAFADYSLMGSNDLAINTALSSAKSNTIIMQNHGAITLGKSLREAYEKMEVLEASAKSNFILKFMQNKTELPAGDVQTIDELFGNSF